jgi:VIT1/CCC1 family predicted Fe2+/Mn2+ transporter
LALGLSDGILNALILASAALLHGGRDLTIPFAMKVGCVAFVTAVFTMFVAEYAELRSHLSRATDQLNLSSSGHLASTHLGRRVILMAAQAALIASVSSFIGATIPLIVAGALPDASWIGLAVAIALLGALGVALAASVGGRWPRWVLGLILAGVAVAIIGSRLSIT